MKKVIIFFLLICCYLLPVSAQETEFSNLTGQKFSYPELIAAPKTVLLTWAVWCPYCRRELERLADKCVFFEEVEVFFVNIGEKKSLVDKFADSRNLKDCVKDRIILDLQYSIAKKFNIIGIPTYLFFKNGQFLEKTYFLDQEIIQKIYGLQ